MLLPLEIIFSGGGGEEGGRRNRERERKTKGRGRSKKGRLALRRSHWKKSEKTKKKIPAGRLYEGDRRGKT